MKRFWTLPCCALVALALVPSPALADVVSPLSEGRDKLEVMDEPSPEDQPSPEEEGEGEKSHSGCSNAAVASYVGATPTIDLRTVGVVACLTLSATAGIVYLSEKRSL